MAKSGSKRKRQTQLSFSPLPSSSPARASQPAAIRDRAAAITVEGPFNRTRRRTTLISPLPTPNKSSQAQSPPRDDESSASLSDELPARRKTRSFMAGKTTSEKQQTSQRPPAGSDIIDTFHDSESDVVVVQSKRKDHSNNVISEMSRTAQYNKSESDEAAPRKRIKSNHVPADTSDDGPASNDTSDSDVLPTPRRRRLRRPRPVALLDRDVHEEADLEEDLEFLGSGSASLWPPSPLTVY